jgi:Fe-S-cluster containining protein
MSTLPEATGSASGDSARVIQLVSGLGLASSMLEGISQPLSEESPCGKCIAACCRQGTKIELSPPEVELMVTAGNTLTIVGDTPGFKGLQAGNSIYAFEQDCVFLDRDSRRCGIWGTGKQPKACGSFPAGERACIKMEFDQRKRLDILGPMLERLGIEEAA